MWKLSEINPDSTYVIQLCHDSGGRRFLQLRDTNYEESRNLDVVFETEAVPHELLKARDVERISRDVELAGGGMFIVDAHNIWFTPEELDALEDEDCDWDTIEWCTPTPPILF